jgi:hypothetical protein
MNGFNFFFQKIENSPAEVRDGLSLRQRTLSLKLLRRHLKLRRHAVGSLSHASDERSERNTPKENEQFQEQRSDNQLFTNCWNEKP